MGAAAAGCAGMQQLRVYTAPAAAGTGWKPAKSLLVTWLAMIRLWAGGLGGDVSE
jgi:hypothetical protein